ncbi:hypothetical protein BR93DRAFT_135425 [Coniochaeta sp. PMI_546]|nr:hypothetical protein BR93DRAFT_135425 [Coniochaeta sp. PMI_546]
MANRTRHYTPIRHHSSEFVLQSTPVTPMAILAGPPRQALLKKRGELDEDDFWMSSDNAQWWFCIPVFCWVIIPYFQNLADEADWLWYVVRLLVLLIYV